MSGSSRPTRRWFWASSCSRASSPIRSRISAASAFAFRPGASRFTRGQQHHRVAQIRVDRLRHPGVLDLHGIVAVDRRGAMDLTDRGRCERTLVEVAEHALERTAELLAHQLLEVSEPNRRDVVAERSEPAAARPARPREGRRTRPSRSSDRPSSPRHASARAGRRAGGPAPRCASWAATARSGVRIRLGGSHPGPAQALPRHEPADTVRASRLFGQPSRLSERISRPAYPLTEPSVGSGFERKQDPRAG